MSSIFEIPLTNAAQKLHVSLSGTDYTFWLNWNTISSLWRLDIGDTSENLLVGGIAVVTGCNLFGPYAYLGFPGSLIAQGAMNPDDPPDYNTLGTTSHIFWISPI